MSSQDEDFATLLAEFGAPPKTKRVSPGDKVTGTLVSIGKEFSVLDLGGGAEAMLPSDELREPDGTMAIAVGAKVDARVLEVERRNGPILVQKSTSRAPKGKAELFRAFEHGIPVEGTVGAVIKGGVEVTVSGERGFCPVSQLDNRFVEKPEDYTGQKLAFLITRYEEGPRGVNLVVSRKSLLQSESSAKAQVTRETLAVGAIFTGTVTGFKPFGAFVDFGGVEGMIHISELGHDRVEKPEDVLSLGQTIDVQVLKIEKTTDPKRPEKIALSLKSMAEDPWADKLGGILEGTRHSGKVTRLQPFGAFVELAPGLEGLVHISELGAGRRIQHPKEVVAVGDTIEVEVLEIDRAKRRLRLSVGSVKAAQERADLDEARTHAPKAPKSLGTFGDLLAKMGKK